MDNQNTAKIYLVFVDFIWFSLNSFMRTHGQRLQEAYRQHIAPYSEHLQFAVTLTLKQSAQIVTTYANGEGIYKRCEYLNEDKLVSSIRYFNALLTRTLFGNYRKHPNKKSWATPLAIYSIEGRNIHKRLHIHAAIGNVPIKHCEEFPTLVASAWMQCDFAYSDIDVESIYDAAGWLGYITKQAGYTDNDCLDICSSVVPPFIQQGICT